MGRMRKMLFVTLILLLPIFFGFFLIKNIIEYKNFDSEELTYQELTFEKYVFINRYKTRADTYEVYFFEYDEPFVFDNISIKKLNKTHLDNLKAGDSVKIYYKSINAMKYKYSICAMRKDTAICLHLSDYKTTNKSNYITGIIILSIFSLLSFALCALLLFIFVFTRK